VTLAPWARGPPNSYSSFGSLCSGGEHATHKDLLSEPANKIARNGGYRLDEVGGRGEVSPTSCEGGDGQRQTAICIVDEAGKIVWERMVATDPEVIAGHLARHAPVLERVGLESGATSAWLWREFRGRGVPAVCLDSRHAHRVLSMKRNKNDRNDARGLGWHGQLPRHLRAARQ
jgi:hypothetical protein